MAQKARSEWRANFIGRLAKRIATEYIQDIACILQGRSLKRGLDTVNRMLRVLMRGAQADVIESLT